MIKSDQHNEEYQDSSDNDSNEESTDNEHISSDYKAGQNSQYHNLFLGTICPSEILLGVA